jgi:hypothetical protein
VVDDAVDVKETAGQPRRSKRRPILRGIRPPLHRIDVFLQERIRARAAASRRPSSSECRGGRPT